MTPSLSPVRLERMRTVLDGYIDRGEMPRLGLDAPIDDVVPAKRAITLRDLLALHWGFGAVMVWPPAIRFRRRWEQQG
jgi:hypothetical protein